MQWTQRCWDPNLCGCLSRGSIVAEPSASHLFLIQIMSPNSSPNGSMRSKQAWVAPEPTKYNQTDAAAPWQLEEVTPAPHAMAEEAMWARCAHRSPLERSSCRKTSPRVPLGVRYTGGRSRKTAGVAEEGVKEILTPQGRGSSWGAAPKAVCCSPCVILRKGETFPGCSEKPGVPQVGDTCLPPPAPRPARAACPDLHPSDLHNRQRKARITFLPNAATTQT
ncbi:uncharacterized protein LOC130149190 [Falco biarmicus]|uniref:uncharacterized protein LOC129735837 n=1 Tax=Falco cherrug TaxID=345164 RepID=UPI002478D5D2|nr:uncharacterized protein LOC129735837 [Falco cherrug]XP_056194512.1 uncharacterized protein LOC130149190 [Falco biarmicus]